MKLRILVVCQYYYPEPFRLPDICEELAKRGNEVTLITGVPNYPMGETYEGYSKKQRRDETINGVKVHRCFTIPRKHGPVYRLLNYYSYALSSKSYLKRLKESYDVVFVNQQSPIMMANGAIAYKKRHNKKIVLYCMDLWPESLISGGIKKDSVIYKWFFKESRRVYRDVDLIVCTSKSFSEYFEKQFGILGVEYLPQYAESLFKPEDCTKNQDEYLDLMFAGNVGAAQSVETIIAAAKLTAEESHIRWHIVGEGSELGRLQLMATSMSNVFFHGRKPIEDMPKYYAMADVMLVTMQKDPVLSLTLPGKVQTYMAAGKPILGAIDGETQIVIKEANCGICGEAEDANQLAQNALALMKDRRCYAENSLKYYRENFSKERFIQKMTDYLTEECT